MRKNKELWLHRRKRVLELFKERPYRYSELVKTTRLPEKTVDRILIDLRVLGLIIKRADGYWAWFEQLREPYRTKDEKDDALEHSRKLVPGLESILAEGRQSHSDAVKSEAEAMKVEVEGGPRLKEFSELHLKTGYPALYEKLEEYRELRANARRKLELEGKYPNQIINFVVDGIVTFPKDVEEVKKWPLDQTKQPPEDLIEILNQRADAYSQLEREIRKIELFIQLGRPLDGCCEACKGIKIFK